MRIVLDTNLLVRALISPGGCAGRILAAVQDRAEHTLILSPYLLAEVADVLQRDRIRTKWALTSEDIDNFCGMLADAAEVVSPDPLPPAIRDTKDQKVIETAVTGQASVLCTLDTHFFENAVQRFCQERSIRILNDVELLQLIRSERED